VSISKNGAKPVGKILSKRLDVLVTASARASAEQRAAGAP